MTLLGENLKIEAALVQDQTVSNIEEEKHIARASLSCLTPNHSSAPPWSIPPGKHLHTTLLNVYKFDPL